MKLSSRLLIFLMLVSVLLSLSVSASATGLYDLVEAPEMGAQYYLVADVDGTDYFFRNTKSGESVTHTAPYSVCTTTSLTDASIRMLTLVEVEGGFTLDYPDGSKRIYSYDVDNDGVVDTGVNAKSVAANHYFSWDAENKYIYMMKSGVQYVLSVKKLLSSGSGQEEYRMLTVPASEVGAANGVYPVRFAKPHECTFSDEWTADENSHWHACSCGEKKNLQLHQVTDWTVTKEPAVGVEGSRKGTCSVCAAEVVETIEALKEETQAPTATGGQEDTIPGSTGSAGTTENPQPSGTIDPIGLAAVIALAVTGLAIMIWGKKKDKA